MKRVVRRLMGGLVAVGCLLGLAPLSLLALVGETREGRMFGGAAAGLLMATVCLTVCVVRSPTRVWPWTVGIVLGLTLAIGLFLGLVRSTPRADPDRATGLVSDPSKGSAIPRFSPARLLPEIDQVKLVLTLTTRLIPWSARARTIREVTLDLYREIEIEGQRLGPVTHDAALELLGANFGLDHSFAYVPRAQPGETLGLLVFLHGNGGNFQVLPWAWRTFAEKRRMIILCPTFGFGFWGEGGVEAVDRAWLGASNRWPIDPHRVYLAGLSDGGVGVTRSAAAHPDRYRGLIYLSPTMNLEELAQPRFSEGWKGRPIQVFQGVRDFNVPKSTVDPAVDLLRRQGSTVDYNVFEGEDHFLFFARRLEVFDRIESWMNRSEEPLATEKAGKR